MLKKILAWLLVISTTATIAVGGTLAYLTDRESEANVFTVGDVDITLNDEFQQESQLKPGVDIEKNVSIKNEGPNDAYVWYTYAVPQGLEKGLVLSFEENTKWSDGELIGTKTVDGVTYNVYVSKYSEAISDDATTEVGLTKVAMDPAVDITTEGEAYLVNSGVTERLNWNINDTENPVIFINAYAIQTQDFADVDAAYEAFKGQWGDMVEAGTYEVAKADTWDGTADTSWYNDTDTEFTLTTAEQLAGLAELVDGGNTFAGKTVKLGADLDLYAENTADPTEPLTFNNIGDKDNSFNGILDGQNHTISNLFQNGWILGYEWGKYGSMGLFGYLNDATVKNLTISGAECFVEGGNLGGIAGRAIGDCTFENITISDSLLATYNNGVGGIVGWSELGNYTFKNITISENTTIAGMWGSYDATVGGVLAEAEPGATYHFEDVDVACRLDVYNDYTGSYQWGSYRMCGMIIGRVLEVTQTGSATYIPNPAANNVTCENVKVTYGDWANYTYCHFQNMGSRYVREQAGYRWDAYTHTSTWEAPTDVNGNKVTDSNHAHADGEDHSYAFTFDQLFGGPQSNQRAGYYGLPAYDGVTVIYNNK